MSDEGPHANMGETRLKAVRDTIIIFTEYSTQSKGGIYIPEVAKQYHGSFMGRVVDVGPEYPYDVKPGDRIAYVRHEGHVILHKGNKYLSLRAKWVVGREKRKEEK